MISEYSAGKCGATQWHLWPQ